MKLAVIICSYGAAGAAGVALLAVAGVWASAASPDEAVAGVAVLLGSALLGAGFPPDQLPTLMLETGRALVDEAGTVGRQYGAKTTPHMYVIDPQGTLVYAGGLDNAPRNEQPAAGYVPFTAQAIDAVLAGEPVATSKTQAWGCSVKYGS